MSSPSPIQTPANGSDDIALTESLGISIGDSSQSDDSDEFESEVAQPEALTPSASVSSVDDNSPSNSHRSHSPDLDGQDSADSSGNGNVELNAQGQRIGNGEKRPSQYDNRRNLHVDNLPPMTEVEFRNLFLTFGPIARSRIVTDTITGLPAGYGFVMFENEADAAMALQALHTTYLPNSTKPLRVTVKKPKTAKAWEREREKEAEKQKLLAHVPVNIQTIFVNTNLYVAGLPANWTKREMDEIFSQHGMILESRILLEKHSHISKGVGFVRFQQLECCHQAIQALNGKPPPVPPSLKANGKTNAATANNPNANREDSKQNLTVRFAVDKTAQALAVAQQTVMGTLNQRNSLQHNHNGNHHQNSRSEVGANVSNQKYFAVLNSQNLQQTAQRSNSPSLQAHTIQANVHGNYPAMSAFSTQQIQSLLAMQQQHLARAAALATVSGSNRNSFTGNNSPSNTSANFPFSASPPAASSRLSDPLSDLSAYSLENALLLSQLNSPLTSSALSLNQLAAAAGLSPLNLPALSLAPPANSAAALNQFYSANSLSTLTPFANPVYVG